MNDELPLALPELMIAGYAGVMRRGSAMKAQRQQRYGLSNVGLACWAADVGGAAGEMVVAKRLDRYWSPLAPGRLSDVPADIGDEVQVRSTEHRDGSLILHPDDPDEHLFYLVVTADLPRCRIIGPLRAEVGKHERYWRTAGVRHPAYFVPQEDLLG